MSDKFCTLSALMGLIESDWNLKKKVKYLVGDFETRINRIRLEFKDCMCRSYGLVCQGINRIRLEFKVF